MFPNAWMTQIKMSIIKTTGVYWTVYIAKKNNVAGDSFE